MLKSVSTQTLFYLLLTIGLLLRFFHFGANPTGLHGDEASIGYEAFSLLETGADRWGYKLPAYFLSWGSGQNTLYGYLSIPFVYLFGLNEVSVRMLSGVLGILCVPMAYKICIVLFEEKNLARLAAILYIFDPFLFMTSRWGDEFNIVPFFVLLFLLLLAMAVKNTQKPTQNLLDKLSIISVFPAMVLLFYCYAPSLFIVPLFGLFIVVSFWKFIQKQILYFSISAGLAAIIVLPFTLFILKNNILKHNLPFENALPFSLPLMLSPRERIFIGIGENLAIIKQNMFFVFSGFIDLYVWIYNTTHFRIPHYFVIFMLPAIIYLFSILKNKLADPRNIILLWLLASFSIFFLYHVNLNRSLHFQSVMPMAVAIGMFTFFKKIEDGSFRKLVLVLTFLFFTFQASSFFGEYFIKYPSYSLFAKDMKWAIDIASKNQRPNEKIAISKDLVFNYLYVLFYTKYPPAKFQKEVETDKTTGNVIVHSFANYYMLGDVVNVPKTENWLVIEKLKQEKNFIAILHNNEQPPYFTNFNEEIIKKDENHDWKIVRFVQKNK